jgi:hypothetical protein
MERFADGLWQVLVKLGERLKTKVDERIGRLSPPMLRKKPRTGENPPRSSPQGLKRC